MNLNHSVKFSQYFDEVFEKRKINFLVLHHIQADSVQHALDQLYNHQVSAHFLIDDQGNVFELVEENNIAYHAGVSYWQGVNGLNKNSIGIELISKEPFQIGFSDMQMDSLVLLCRNLINKYLIPVKNIVGHSDIAYFNDSELLDRKQDPSHLFNWEYLAKNGIGIFPKITNLLYSDRILHSLNDIDPDISRNKLRLKNFGYKITNLSNVFDYEMQSLVRVFNRRFNPKKYQENPDLWYLSSQLILNKLV